VTTATTEVYTSFTTAGTTSWTAPAGVKGVQYLVVAGGGGGGGCYSEIEVIGDIPFVASNPGSATTYWINSTAGSNYGYLYKGASRYTTTGSCRITVPSAGNTYGTAIVPFGGYTDPTVRWYSSELVYSITSGLPSVTNYGRPSYTIPSVYNNRVSGGSGGGAGAQVKAIFTITSFYNVIPGNSYTVIVGDGGEGGTADTNIENAGAKGGDSTFDTITSEGGSGGQPSRVYTNNTDGYNNGGRGQTTKNYLIGGYGAIYILRKENGKWNIIGEVGKWYV
jgi:hypothetical protein